MGQVVVNRTAREFAAMQRALPNDPLVQLGQRVLDRAARNSQSLSPAHRLLVGKSLAILVDLKRPDSSKPKVGDESGSWLSDVYDSLWPKAVEAERAHYQDAEAKAASDGMLAIANTLDEAQHAVKNGLENADLLLANALERVWESITDSAKNVVKDITRNLWLPVALIVGTVLVVRFARPRASRRFA